MDSKHPIELSSAQRLRNPRRRLEEADKFSWKVDRGWHLRRALKSVVSTWLWYDSGDLQHEACFTDVVVIVPLCGVEPCTFEQVECNLVYVSNVSLIELK